VDFVINARDTETIESVVDGIRRQCGVAVVPIAADITTEAGRRAVLAASPQPDILVTNAGGPAPGDFRNVEREDWIRALDANMLIPMRETVDGMVARRFGRILNIATSGVKSPGTYPHLGVSIGVRAGLTGFVGVLARQVAADNVTINNVLPGRIDTDRLRETLAVAAAAARHSSETEAARAIEGIPANRFGQPEEFGAICAFLCSMHTGYITGRISCSMAAHSPACSEGGASVQSSNGYPSP
jgi:3-oxoacyl-[acyl-carrier protein] reductase